MFHHDNDNVNGTSSMFRHANDNDNDTDNDNGNTYNQSQHLNEDQVRSYVLYERYINKITKVLNKRGKDDLYELYDKNEKFSEDLFDFIRDKLDLRNEQFLDERRNYIAFNRLDYENYVRNMQGMYFK